MRTLYPNRAFDHYRYRSPLLHQLREVTRGAAVTAFHAPSNHIRHGADSRQTLGGRSDGRVPCREAGQPGFDCLLVARQGAVQWFALGHWKGLAPPTWSIYRRSTVVRPRPDTHRHPVFAQFYSVKSGYFEHICKLNTTNLLQK